MIIDDVLEAKNYDNNVSANYAYTTLFEQYKFMLNKQKYSVDTKQEKLLLIKQCLLKAYCGLIVQDVNNNRREYNTVDFNVKWKFDLMRHYYTNSPVQFDEWFGNTTYRNDLVLPTDIHDPSYNNTFNPTTPVYPSQQSINQTAIGIALLNY